MAAKRNDMARLGVFSELGYTTIGDPYVSHYRKPFNDAAGKGKQMLMGSTKSKSALQAGYFTEQFGRMLEGEAYTDIVQIRRRGRLEQAKKNLAKSWVPSNGDKLPSGLGSNFGCFDSRTDAFSAATKPKDKYKSAGHNLYTCPAKKGTGYGFIGVTIGQLPKHSPDPYSRAHELRKKEVSDEKKKRKGGPFKLNSHMKEYFDNNPYHSKKPLPPGKDVEPKSSSSKPKPFKPSSPAKSIGGCKAGTFDPYPTHSTDDYMVKGPKNDKKFVGGIFTPNPGIKSMPTRSVVSQHVLTTMNTSNYMSVPISS